VDGSGNVYVTGFSSYSGGTSDDYVTIKYVPIVTVELNCLTPWVERGDKLCYEVTFTNHTSQSQTFKYWAKAKLPNGNCYTQLVA